MAEKKPWLFYYEEAESAFCPVPDRVADIISDDILDDGEEFKIRFKRIDMTDDEFANHRRTLDRIHNRYIDLWLDHGVPSQLAHAGS